MLVRFGYVAMSNLVKNASPSKRMTATQFEKIEDREAALRKLERIGAENIHNTLRLLKHNRAHDIHLFRMSSKLIPLVGHESTQGWNPIGALKDEFRELGAYANQHSMRLSFHPDHFTVINTPRKAVLESSLKDLDFHVDMLEAMELEQHARLNIHLGGSYNNKEKSRQRFIDNFPLVSPRAQSRLMLENDDKTYTALETLEVCEELKLPMVLDVHHHMVNHNGESVNELWPRIDATWREIGIPPKIHLSSPKNEKDIRSHADFIRLEDIVPFLHVAKETTPHLDIMIEAKAKDEALFKLIKDLRKKDEFVAVDQATIEMK